MLRIECNWYAINKWFYISFSLKTIMLIWLFVFQASQKNLDVHAHSETPSIEQEGKAGKLPFANYSTFRRSWKQIFLFLTFFYFSKKSMQDMLSAFITGFNQQTIQGIWKSIYKVSTFVDARYWRVNILLLFSSCCWCCCCCCCCNVEVYHKDKVLINSRVVPGELFLSKQMCTRFKT